MPADRPDSRAFARRTDDASRLSLGHALDPAVSLALSADTTRTAKRKILRVEFAKSAPAFRAHALGAEDRRLRVLPLAKDLHRTRPEKERLPHTGGKKLRIHLRALKRAGKKRDPVKLVPLKPHTRMEMHDPSVNPRFGDVSPESALE
jgi:hypothetical protein